MKSVLIMMSTYNGHQYLREQLDSLYRQAGVDIHILVRDDGSKDDTVEILNEYKRQKGKMTIIAGINIGVGRSFLSLIKEATERFSIYNYFAFCDQDDVWFEHKLESGVKVLNLSNSQYKMYFSNVVKTDEGLNPIKSFAPRLVNSFGANVVANHILGCTMIINRSLLVKANNVNVSKYEIPDGLPPIHDAWVALVAYSLNAEVIQGQAGAMFYRQHKDNVIGAGHGFLSIQKKRIKRYLNSPTHGKSNKCIMALQVINDIPKENRNLLEKVANYRKSKKTKLKLITDRRMYEYGLLDNIETFLTLLFNKF